MNHGNRSKDTKCDIYSPKVSVIVPVYNVEGYLEQCIGSITRQTLEDIEIILVDDGSTDSSGRICDNYAQFDRRIKVLHKSNGGLSSARNEGISIATAPFIMFVDGDDWVEENFCEFPYRLANDEKADLVLFLYNRIDKNGKSKTVLSKIPSGLLSEEKGIIYNIYYASYAWLGLYERDLFENIRYPVGKIHEDVYTSHRIIHSAKKIYLINAPLYNYRSGRPGSITSSFDIKSNKDVRYVMTSKINDLCSWGYEKYTRKDALKLLIWYGWKCDEQKPYAKIIFRSENMLSQLTWKQKILFLLFRFSPALFDIACVITGNRIKS